MLWISAFHLISWIFWNNFNLVVWMLVSFCCSICLAPEKRCLLNGEKSLRISDIMFLYILDFWHSYPSILPYTFIKNIRGCYNICSCLCHAQIKNISKSYLLPSLSHCFIVTHILNLMWLLTCTHITKFHLILNLMWNSRRMRLLIGVGFF